MRVEIINRTKIRETRKTLLNNNLPPYVIEAFDAGNYALVQRVLEALSDKEVEDYVLMDEACRKKYFEELEKIRKGASSECYFYYVWGTNDTRGELHESDDVLFGPHFVLGLPDGTKEDLINLDEYKILTKDISEPDMFTSGPVVAVWKIAGTEDLDKDTMDIISAKIYKKQGSFYEYEYLGRDILEEISQSILRYINGNRVPDYVIDAYENNDMYFVENYIMLTGRDVIKGRIRLPHEDSVVGKPVPFKHPIFLDRRFQNKRKELK